MTNFYEQQFKGRTLEEMSSGTDLESPLSIRKPSMPQIPSLPTIFSNSPLSPSLDVDSHLDENNETALEVKNPGDIVRFEESELPGVSILSDSDTFNIGGTFPERLMELFNCFNSGSSFARTYCILSDIVDSLDETVDKVHWDNDFVKNIKDASDKYLSLMLTHQPTRKFEVGDTVKSLYPQNYSGSYDYNNTMNRAFPVGSHGTIAKISPEGFHVKFLATNWPEISEDVAKGRGGKIKTSLEEKVVLYDNAQVEFVPINAIHKRSFELKLEALSYTLRGFSSDLHDLVRGYEEFRALGKNDMPYSIADKIRPSKDRILNFSRSLFKFENIDYIAPYLNALMIYSPDNEFELDLTKANSNLNGLGRTFNNQKLVVYGDVGERVGSMAKNSKIIINGNTNRELGTNSENCQIFVTGNTGGTLGNKAKNSQIIVNGNAGGYLGNESNDCKIMVYGDAEYKLGNKAKNAQIYIHGNCGELSDSIYSGTKIFKAQGNAWEQIFCDDPIETDENLSDSLDSVSSGGKISKDDRGSWRLRFPS